MELLYEGAAMKKIIILLLALSLFLSCKKNVELQEKNSDMESDNSVEVNSEDNNKPENDVIYFLNEDNTTDKEYLLFDRNEKIFLKVQDDPEFYLLGEYKYGISHSFIQQNNYDFNEKCLKYDTEEIQKLDEHVFKVCVDGWDGFNQYYIIDLLNKKLLVKYAISLFGIQGFGDKRKGYDYLEVEYENNVIVKAFIERDDNIKTSISINHKTDGNPIGKYLNDDDYYYEVLFNSVDLENNSIKMKIKCDNAEIKLDYNYNDEILILP